VSLEIRDATGAVIATLAANANRGLHVAEWPLLRTGAGGPGAFGRGRVDPGAYTAVLTVDGVSRTTPVGVERD
jgi:hypothetical protein